MLFRSVHYNVMLLTKQLSFYVNIVVKIKNNIKWTKMFSIIFHSSCKYSGLTSRPFVPEISNRLKLLMSPRPPRTYPRVVISSFSLLTTVFITFGVTIYDLRSYSTFKSERSPLILVYLLNINITH